jgi:hypothetical protein
VVLLQLGAGLVPPDLLGGPVAPATGPASAARGAEPAQGERSAARRRVLAVERLLAARSAALLARDRAAFLASVDPSSPDLRARQEALFDALAAVPLGRWTYTLDHSSSPPTSRSAHTGNAHAEQWAPDVTLEYALDGFDERPVSIDLSLTFRSRGGVRWYLSGDDAPASRQPAFWEQGPVVAVREQGVLVLGRPGAEDLLHEVAATTAAALPGVTSVWGPWAERVVVLVPQDAQEMASLLGGAPELSQIAAVATAEVHGDHAPTGHRVLVNPDTFSGLGALGRRVVLTHEATHIATRAATGPGVPAWLAEGLADHIAYRDVDLPPSVVARHLAADVRAGHLPAALPSDREFDGASARLTHAYEGAWLAVRMLAQSHGEASLLRLYRSVGAARGVPADRALESALQRELGTTTAEVTARWRTALTQQLG